MQVPGAEVTVYRIQDPIRGDDHALFDDGVLDAPPVMLQVQLSCQGCVHTHCDVWGHLQDLHLSGYLAFVSYCRASEAVNLGLLTLIAPVSGRMHSFLQDIKDADSVSLGALMASQVSVPVVQDIRDADAVILRALMASQVQILVVQDIRNGDAVILGAPGRLGGMCAERAGDCWAEILISPASNGLSPGAGYKGCRCCDSRGPRTSRRHVWGDAHVSGQPCPTPGGG